MASGRQTRLSIGVGIASAVLVAAILVVAIVVAGGDDGGSDDVAGDGESSAQTSDGGTDDGGTDGGGSPATPAYCRLVEILFGGQPPQKPQEYILVLRDGWTITDETERQRAYREALTPDELADELALLRGALNNSTQSGDPAPLEAQETIEATETIIGFNQQDCA